jgi:hypothetical protein
VNGEPSCANEWLLKTVLREAWQFDGYVTSDCDAEGDTAMRNRYPDPSDAVAAILRAGTDVDCGGFMFKNANQSIIDGKTTEADFDVILRRQFRLRLRLGMFDPPGALDKIGTDQVCLPSSFELARDGVRQSVVLAKNLANALPLTASSFASAVVIGPLASSIGIGTTTYYGSVPCANMSFAPLDAIQQHISATTAVNGVPSVGSNDTSGIAAAATAAASAPLVVLAVGSDLSLEREGHDRLVTNFSSAQLALIDAVTAAATGPVVALVFSGGAMDVSPLLANPKIAGILICGQPSVQVVGAGDVLFGKTLDGRPVAPAGRMSQMTYPAAYVDQVSMFDFGMRPGPSAWPPGTNPGRTYRFYTGTPVLPFGYGLSYTTWAYTPLPDPMPPVSLARVEAAALAHAAAGVLGHVPASLQETAAQFWVNVTNSGSVDSDDVVLGFLVPPGAGVDGVPLQELFGFQRVFVPAGQTVTVYLGAQGVRFTQAGVDGVRRVLRGEYKVRFGVRETAELGSGFAELGFTAA